MNLNKKIAEISEFVWLKHIDLVIFDQRISEIFNQSQTIWILQSSKVREEYADQRPTQN